MSEKPQTTGPFQGHQKNQKRELITCVVFNKDILDWESPATVLRSRGQDTRDSI